MKFIFSHKAHGVDYSKWYLDHDMSVTEMQDNRYIGGELSSRIMTDTRNTWLELKKICEILEKSGCVTNECCSNHINIDIANCYQDNYFIETLAKLIAVYEKEISLFYMGDKYLYRSTRAEYARSMKFSLLSKIRNIDFKSDIDDLYYNIKYSGTPTFLLKDGINLQKINETKRMEIRYPNGTISPKTIQNNINFSLKLVDAIIDSKFDLSILDRKIDEEISKEDFIYGLIFDEVNPDKLEELIDIISTNPEDKKDFTKQYKKIMLTRS